MTGPEDTRTITVTEQEAWMLYDLVAAKVETITAAQLHAMADCGLDPWVPIFRELGRAVGRPS